MDTGESQREPSAWLSMASMNALIAVKCQTGRQPRGRTLSITFIALRRGATQGRHTVLWVHHSLAHRRRRMLCSTVSGTKLRVDHGSKHRTRRVLDRRRTTRLLNAAQGRHRRAGFWGGCASTGLSNSGRWCAAQRHLHFCRYVTFYSALSALSAYVLSHGESTVH